MSPTLRAQTTNVIGVDVPAGSTRNDAYPGAGFEFFVPSGGATINAIGYWDASGAGLMMSHTVTLFKYAGSGSSYHAVLTATIPPGTAAPLINGYRWVGIPTTTLPNNGQNGGYYTILADHALDAWANTIGSAPYLNPLIGTVSGQGLIDNSTTFTLLGDPINIAGTGNPNQGFGGPNLAFLTNALPASATPAQITWVETGSFADNSVLAKAGPTSNEVYGVDFGGSGPQTTANGYAFDDYQTTGDATIGGTANASNIYLSGGGTTGDAALDSILNNGVFGDAGTYCILNNLTVGQKYTVLALAADTTSSGNNAQFQETDYLTYSPAQTFAFAGGASAIGGYVMGTFTAAATNQIFSMRSAGHYQYNGILLEKYTPPVLPLIVVVTNPQPASLTLGVGGQVTYTAAFSNSPAVNIQWQFIANGTTNDINTGVVTVTNGNILVSSLTVTNLQASNAGSYLAKATDVAHADNIKYTTAASLSVNSLIYWLQSGTFTDNSVLAVAGDPTNEVYGVYFGGAGPLSTANGYSFDDFVGAGNMDVATGYGTYGGYLTGGATTGDNNLDFMLTTGVYGGTGNTGTLKNLTVGQTYYVLVLLDDTRGSAAGGSVFHATDGVTISPGQPYAFANGAPSVGGYLLGRFTAGSTTQPLSVFNVLGGASQYNAILLAKAPAPTNAPIYITSDISPTSATVAEGGQASFSVTFDYSPALVLQWQSVINGVTNNVNVGVSNAMNGTAVTSTLSLSNISAGASGSYFVRATDATNSLNFVYSSAASLTVVPVITWTAGGPVTDNSVLALAGAPSTVVYAADFGGSGTQTTANGYTFNDFTTSSNISLTGHSDFGGYISGGATTGDAAFDNVLTSGSYGGGVTATLDNLIPGQKYTVLVLLDDTRGSAAGGVLFRVSDGVNFSGAQQYGFTNGVPAVGGYLLGAFTANSTSHPIEIQTSYFGIVYTANQYNAIIVAKASAAPPGIVVNTPRIAGGNLILTGTGALQNTGYTWLTSPDVSAPLSTWTTNSTGVTDGSGAFSNAVPVPANPAAFFRLRLP